MKIIFKTAELIRNLKDIVKIIPSTVTRQSLRYVHIKADKDAERVDISASTEGVSIRRTIWELALGSQVTIEEGGECFLPGRELLEMLKKYDGDDVIFESTGQGKVGIRCGKSDLNLAGLDPTLFVPYKSDSKHDTVATVTAKALNKLINRTAYAASKVETRPILTGINLAVTDSGVKASSTDGLRLSQQTVEATVMGSKNITIPRDPLAQLASLLPNDEDEEVTLEIGDSTLSATWDDDAIHFSVRALSGTYPDISKITQAVAQAKWMKIDREVMLDACERLRIISDAPDGKKEMHVEFDDGIMLLTAECQSVGDYKEPVSILEDTGIKKLPMLFNCEYWRDVLHAIDAETIQVAIVGQNQPAGFKVDDNDLAIVSPMAYVRPSRLSDREAKAQRSDDDGEAQIGA